MFGGGKESEHSFSIYLQSNKHPGLKHIDEKIEVDEAHVKNGAFLASNQLVTTFKCMQTRQVQSAAHSAVHVTLGAFFGNVFLARLDPVFVFKDTS